MMRHVFTAAAAIAAALMSGAASAVVAVGQDYTFNFSGTCTDCRGIDTAQLKLTNYVLGNEILSTNFVSFHFDGSNLYGAFTITSPIYLYGAITTTGSSAERFGVYDYSNFFTSATDGSWQLGRTAVEDYGTNGRFVSAASSAAPEPASWAMMVAGFGLVGAAVRGRRSTAKVRFA